MGGGGPSSITPQGQIDSYNQYAADTDSTRQAIIADTSIDSISKQELLNSLSYTNPADPVDPLHTGDSANVQIANVNAQLAKDESTDPFYVNRRNTEDTMNALITQPGEKQTNLTESNQTPMGTPTLLTASANAQVTGGGPVG